MEVVKKADGSVSYKEKIYLDDGKTVTKTFSRKTDAKAWKNQMTFEREKSLALGIQPIKNITFADLANLWIDNKIKLHRKPKTQYEYQSILNSRLLPKFGHQILRLISRAAVESFQSDLSKEGLDPRTINKVVGVITTVLGHGVRNGFLYSNHIQGISRLRLKSKPPRFLSDSECAVLLNYARFTDVYAIIVVALNTGLRPGETTGLCWDCVNWKTGQLEIRRTKSRFGLQESTKTHLIRYVPMNDQVLQQLKQLQKNQRSPEFVFVKKDGSEYNGDHFNQRHFQPIVKNAGLEKVNFRHLRHTFASHFMMNGGNLYDLSKILGHTKTEMTMKYAHLAPQHLQSAMKLVSFGEKVEESSPFLALKDLAN